jgi:hypothetical protein
VRFFPTAPRRQLGMQNGIAEVVMGRMKRRVVSDFVGNAVDLAFPASSSQLAAADV